MGRVFKDNDAFNRRCIDGKKQVTIPQQLYVKMASDGTCAPKSFLLSEHPGQRG